MSVAAARGSLLLAALLASRAAPAQVRGEEARFRERRLGLVERWLMPYGITDSATLAAMRSVPRHRFVPPEKREMAYEDVPLPIGHDATISQPFIVALMTQLIRPRAGMRVLEVGTGSGYQAAVLATIGCQVWTIEIVGALATGARRRLDELGFRGIEVRHGDGYLGWPDAAPFDAILVTASADSIPPALVQQLAPGGRLVMPVGDERSVQDLVLVEKSATGALTQRRIESVRFVPLRRGIR